MASPLVQITTVSAAGCLFLILRLGIHSKGTLVVAFAGLWTACLLLYAIWSIFIYPHYVSPLRHLPTAKGGHWLVGHAPTLMTGKEEPSREWLRTIPQDGLLRYYWLFSKERVLISSPKGLAEVLVTKSYQFKRPDLVGKILAPIVGEGILLSEGEVHKVQRRNLMPAFAFRHVKNLYPVFWRKAGEVVDAMTATADGKGVVAELDVLGWANRCTLDIIGVAGLGVDFGSIQNPTNPLAETYRSLMRSGNRSQLLMTLRVILPAWMVERLPMTQNIVTQKAKHTLRRTCADLIRDRKRRMTVAGADKNDDECDILSVALASGHFSDDNLVDQLMTFLAAGHETTATALTWAIYLLSCHPNVQTRLRSEIRERLPCGDNITHADIDRLPYLHAVCSEVLRFFAPVPRTTREATQDTTIQGVGIPKGTVVVVSPWCTNVDPMLWGNDAGEFNPDRWLAEAGRSCGPENNYAFLTFLHGPRSCIGASFARAELACLLAAWVGRFEFALQNERWRDWEELDVRMGVTASIRGLRVRARVLS